MQNEKAVSSVNTQKKYGSISMDVNSVTNGHMHHGSKDGKSTINVLQKVIRRILPKKNDEKTNTVPFYKLYRFATWKEITVIFIALLFGALTGLCIPLDTILYGEFTTLLIDRVVMKGPSTKTVLLEWFGGGKILINSTWEESKAALIDDSIAFGVGCTVLSVIQFIFGVICIDLMNFAALRQISRIRKMFFECVLRQDMTWYDTNTSTNFASSITEDLDKLQNGIGEKVGIFVYLISSFIFSIILSFIYGWELTLVMSSCSPVIIIATAIVAKVQSTLTEKELKSYGMAGLVAEEVLSSMRTVIAFGGEQKEIERYSERLIPATQTGKRKGMYSGIGSGLMWFIIYCTYSLAFWYGVNLILEDRDLPDKEYTPAVLIIVFFGVLAGAQNMGLTSPHLEAFAQARGSAVNVFKILDKKSVIDPLSREGSKLKEITGKIEFKNIHFEYPSRKDVKILRGLNLTIQPGERVAFVGGSGCGKSTLIQLVQRLYDPTVGCVFVDDKDIKEFNIAWLRSHIGVVGQEPVLFATTIYENILHGRPDATREDVEKAAIEANCHEFIKRLPEGYNTVLGERGSQISGGQKQRIAIARALLRKPSILLLDEATSALDLNSEAKVQKALDRASFKCTTLIVSHRLSTIRDVDRIVFIKDGVVTEVGTHNELMEKEGFYAQLVKADLPIENSQHKKNYLKKQNSVNSQKFIVNNMSDSDSESESEEIEEEEKEEEIKNYNANLKRILKMNSPEWPYLLVGSIAAIVVGASFPVFAIIFGEIYGVLAEEDVNFVKEETNKYSIWYLFVGVVTGIGAFLQTYLFNIAGVKLTTRMRITSFAAMTKQEMAWFDEPKNGIGSLCARLSSDAAGIQGATGTWIGAILQALSTFILGIVISMFFTWKLTLVSLVGVPLILCGVFFEGKIMSGQGMREKQAMERSTNVAVEAIANIRTVAGLGREKYFIEKYCVELEGVHKALRVRSRLRGIVFSFGQAVPFLGYALSLYYGGTMVANREVDYKEVIKVSEALIFGAWMMGQALAFAPNFNAARISAGRIFKLLDRVPKIQSPSTNFKDNKNWKCDGTIEYSNINFRYPIRSDIPVLEELHMMVPKGYKVALVGPSGCGKSTCIQLLQRLYDPDNGSVTLDGLDIERSMSLNMLRSQLGIVQQEPVLFDRTIAENIAYGDNTRQVSLVEVQNAAKSANIHGFIVSLPMGYDTRLGTRGTQLSGGQKQRIAIARALVRDPRILLLDEATSALDAQSEQIVQAALDAACEGRTCIIIAHRLSTVRNADIIYVLDSGKVAESGTHQELMDLGRIYNRLYTVNK